MAYVTVPKDLTKIKSKVMFNLTKRQLLCFGAAVAIGLPLFFLTKDSAGTTTAALCIVYVVFMRWKPQKHRRFQPLTFHLPPHVLRLIAPAPAPCFGTGKEYYRRSF